MTEPISIEERDALALHDRLLGLFGGAAGVRDTGLLQSALARPKQLVAYGEHVDTVALAAAYISGIVGNHPFVDGNKRTGFIVGALFLAMNGHRLTATEEDATHAILGLAARTIDEADFAEWLGQNVVEDVK